VHAFEASSARALPLYLSSLRSFCYPPACHPFQQGVVSVAAMGTSRALEKAFDG